MPLTTIAILGFVLIQLGIGYWASRRVADEDDYLVAGRRLGPWVAGFSLFVTWFGAESILGSSAAIRDGGLAGGRADPFGYALSLLLFGVFFAARLWRTGSMTLADVYRSRFGRTAERVAAFVLIPPSVLWSAAQIRALGQILSFQTPLGLEAAIVLSAVIAVLYTYLGGLLGDVWTDVLQGLLVIVGLCATLLALVDHFGGWGESFARIEPAQLRLVAEDESVLARINIWFVPVIGALIAQESVSRALGCRDAPTAKRAALLASGFYLALGAVPVMLGLLGAHYPLPLVHGEDFLPELARHTLAPFVYVLFVGAIVSVILSTIDSSLLAIGALAAHNLFGDSTASTGDHRRLRSARLFVIVSGFLACLIALSAESIYALVLEADSLGTAGIAVITIAALFTRVGGPISASATLVVALASSAIAKYVFEYEAPFVFSLGLSILVFLVLAPLDAREA
ncbi:MAG: sodium:solute symporter family protein [Polyangiales bacterium]|jgi:Na+/proline symporter